LVWPTATDQALASPGPSQTGSRPLVTRDVAGRRYVSAFLVANGVIGSERDQEQDHERPLSLPRTPMRLRSRSETTWSILKGANVHVLGPQRRMQQRRRNRTTAHWRDRRTDPPMPGTGPVTLEDGGRRDEGAVCCRRPDHALGGPDPRRPGHALPAATRLGAVRQQERRGRGLRWQISLPARTCPRNLASRSKRSARRRRTRSRRERVSAPKRAPGGWLARGVKKGKLVGDGLP